MNVLELLARNPRGWGDQRPASEGAYESGDTAPVFGDSRMPEVNFPQDFALQELARYKGHDLTYRPTMLPFSAEYTNRETGETSGGMAWPEVITAPVNTYNRLMDGTAPGYGPDLMNPENQQDITELLLLAFGGHAANNLVKKGAAGLKETARAVGDRFGMQPILNSLLSDTGKPSAVSATIAGAEKAKSPGPGPRAFIPKAETMRASLAETNPYSAFVGSVQDRVALGAEGPFYGPRIPGATDDETLMREALSAFKRDIKEREYDYWPERDYTDDGDAMPVEAYQDLMGATSLPTPRDAPIPAIANAINRAASLAKQDIYINDGGPYGKSAYGQLKSPAGNEYKVRIADHPNQSGHHNNADFNIAPGGMSPEEFIRLLPTIYSDTGRPSIMGPAASSQNTNVLTPEDYLKLLY